MMRHIIVPILTVVLAIASIATSHAQRPAMHEMEALNDSVVNEGHTLYLHDKLQWVLSDAYKQLCSSKTASLSVVGNLNDTLMSGIMIDVDQLKCVFECRLNLNTGDIEPFNLVRGLTPKELERAERQVDLLDLEAVRQAIDDQTSCLFLEIVTNPQMEVADIAALAEIAHERGIPLIADTTIIPFTQFSAKALGVDVEVVSSTKYISGGATSLGGLVIDYGTFPVVNQRIRFELLFNVGSYMSPHAAYMQSLGLETLEARYKVQSSNALALARKLQTVEGIQRVNYIGLEDNPFHTLALKQFGETAGAMLTIDLADRKACFSFIDHLQLIRRATNLFDNKTLAIHPYSTIFGPFGKSQKVEMDVRDTTIRLSVGLEDVDDIFEDIRQAVAAIP